MQLCNHNYKDGSHRAAAHIFVINCFLGLRFQDLYSLQAVHLQKIETPAHGVVTTIQRRQGKNRQLVLVSVPPLAQQLLDSYGGMLPFHLITKHKEALTQFNLAIKEAAEEAKLKRPVRIEKIKNRVVTKKASVLHREISSHIARHTAGSRMQEAQTVKDYPAVRMSGTFDSPGGPGNTPALLPGEAATFTIKARPGDRLQLETMFVQSNDWYYGFGKDGLDLFNGSTPVSGDMTQMLVLYDAGTEEDTPPGTGPFQKPVQPPMATDIGPEDPYGLIAPARERHPTYMIPANSSVIKFTVKPQ